MHRERHPPTISRIAGVDVAAGVVDQALIRAAAAARRHPPRVLLLRKTHPRSRQLRTDR
jgi:hypothetical protein